MQLLQHNDYIFAGVKQKLGKYGDASSLKAYATNRNYSTWISTDYSNEVVEMALAHTIKNATEAAYRRGDLLEKRRNLMEDWAQFCKINRT